ncbi:malto-oligosyltrehalose synthase [Dyella mobilis]|uniref:Malto-oligosyltrehalose synthase n=1 Tax=Dyella mobilis TaxID=1849582 RepID=A0ABS2KD88_9GAMM|nr:malto-oligosyltrehalose synthase [Dyella mobilis]MBM7128848.1 malto-oligosyltrehalose synthase [Dyella mobilis]GLQ99179.1 malto-oligosyltrehalose synthase [Dyella mobilis]
MTVLRATVRLQLNRDFDFAAAAAEVPYFAALGLSHIYLSPIAMARPGSTHGYDVIDPAIVNPELGGEAGLAALVDQLHAHDMGAILDIVPNHLAADLANLWWNDVLAHGEAGTYAGYFDIEWNAPEAEGKLWLPWLDVPLEQALENRRCVLARHTGGVGLGLWLDEDALPVSERSLQWLFEHAGIELPLAAGGRLFDAVRLHVQDEPNQASLDQAISAINADTGLIREFLDLQHYHLGRWRDSGQQLNYRRFFDIHSLAGLRMERDEVFDAVHALPLRLIENGSIDGLRIDHIDGLAQPGHYLRRLRERVDQCSQRDLQRHVTLHVEKILAAGEKLPDDWPVDGTTGYDFMQQLGSLLHDPIGYAELCDAWSTLIGRPADFAQEELTARQYVLSTSLAAELSRCTRRFRELATALDDDRDAEGVPRAADTVRDALHDVLAEMPVYRSYLGDDTITATDRQVLDRAFARAEKDAPPDDESTRATIKRHLLFTAENTPTPGQTRFLEASRYSFEQLSSALNAKAVEDTAFYRHGVLLSRNEVGSAPAPAAPEPESFHAAAHERALRWPRWLLATATHDHKRGEDTRARLAALGERPQAFLEDFNTLSKAFGSRAQPFSFTLWMLLQTLLAAWPLDLRADDAAGTLSFAQRIKAWLRKSEREAKLHTHWTAPDADYEGACDLLVDDLLRGAGYASVRNDLCRAAHRLDAAGALNGLVCATLHFTAPGVPDLYQGTEYWDQSLVDPDNRRAVDYHTRAQTLKQTPDFSALLKHYRDGAIKQHLIYRLLQLRKAWPGLFAEGTYQPIPAAGSHKQHVVAFARKLGHRQLFVAVPRLCSNHLDPSERPMADPGFWLDTRIEAFGNDPAGTFVDVFTSRQHAVKAWGWRAGDLFFDWPVAVLIPSSQADESLALPG